MLRNSLLIGCAMAFVSAFVPGTATAQDNNRNQRTYFTFSAPVELPGKTLPAGTYLFRLVDSPSNRHIVQVLGKDEQDIVLTALAIPARRMDAADEPEVRFMEVAANQPAAIRTWWFPGRTTGHEFIYPKDQATRLAKGSNGPVLTVANDAKTADAMRDAELARVNDSAQTTAVDTRASASAVTGKAVTGRASADTGTRAQAQPPATTPPPAETPATTVPQSTAVTQRKVDRPAGTPSTSTESVQTTRTELPSTATPLPLIALVGFGSLAGAAALRLRRK
jgi:hypothetical protein